MRNTILGLIFIGICGFSIIQSKQAMGVGERAKKANTEVTDNVPVQKIQRKTASGENCYLIDKKEYCGDEAERKIRQLSTPPASDLEERQIGNSKIKEF